MDIHSVSSRDGDGERCNLNSSLDLDPSHVLTFMCAVHTVKLEVLLREKYYAESFPASLGVTLRTLRVHTYVTPYRVADGLQIPDLGSPERKGCRGWACSGPAGPCSGP